MDADVDANGVANGTDMRRAKRTTTTTTTTRRAERTDTLDTGHGTRGAVGLDCAQWLEVNVINLVIPNEKF